MIDVLVADNIMQQWCTPCDTLSLSSSSMSCHRAAAPSSGEFTTHTNGTSSSSKTRAIGTSSSTTRQKLSLQR